VAGCVRRRVTTFVCGACRRRWLRYVATCASVERKCRRIGRTRHPPGTEDHHGGHQIVGSAPTSRHTLRKETGNQTSCDSWAPVASRDGRRSGSARRPLCSATWRRVDRGPRSLPIVASSVSESNECSLAFPPLAPTSVRGWASLRAPTELGDGRRSGARCSPAAVCLRLSYFGSNSQPCNTGHEALFAIRKRRTLAVPSKALERSFLFCEQPQCA
jgi:hypothetical protein